MKFNPHISVKFEGTLKLTEDEMIVLEAIVGYGSDAFLEVFRRRLGKSLDRTNGNADTVLKELFARIRTDVGNQLEAVRRARIELGVGGK